MDSSKSIFRTTSSNQFVRRLKPKAMQSLLSSIQTTPRKSLFSITTLPTYRYIPKKLQLQPSIHNFFTNIYKPIGSPIFTRKQFCKTFKLEKIFLTKRNRSKSTVDKKISFGLKISCKTPSHMRPSLLCKHVFSAHMPLIDKKLHHNYIKARILQKSLQYSIVIIISIIYLHTFKIFIYLYFQVTFIIIININEAS